MRRGGGWAACGVCVSLLLGLPSAQARGDVVASRKAAVAIAMIIQRDARQAGERSRAAVTVSRRCCGLRVLRVHYAIAPAGDVTGGSFVLRVETKRGIVRGVALFESESEVAYKAGAKSAQGSFGFAVAIRHDSAGRNRGWDYTVSYDEVSSTIEAVGGRTHGEGSAVECRVPAPIPLNLYQAAVKLLHSARRHTSFLPPSPPISYCKAPLLGGA